MSFEPRMVIKIGENAGEIEICDVEDKEKKVKDCKKSNDQSDDDKKNNPQYGTKLGESDLKVEWSNPCQWVWWNGRWYWRC
jgi:hypothetical protein